MAKKKKSSTNEAWEYLFNELNILESINKNGYYDISSTTIKNITGKEPRLMAKIDHKQNLPSVMKLDKKDDTKNLSILAIENGKYRIARNSPFIDIEEQINCKIELLKQPVTFTTINPMNITSESSALDIAKVSGMLDIVFQEETELTIRGRKRGNFTFKINSIDYNIKGVQIEVDGGYEGLNSVNLIEAKMGFRDNINIRQLLYPELAWKKYIENKKQIKSYIFYFYDDMFRFIPFVYKNNKFIADQKNERVFKFKTSKEFSLNNIQPLDINKILVDTTVPFPQANSFNRIHAIFLNTQEEECPTKISIIIDFDISLDARQYDYYFNTLKWLGLCTFDGECINITQQGKYLLSLDTYDRTIEFAKIIFSDPICYKILKNLPIEEEDFNRYSKMGDSTRVRRIESIKSWIKYFNNFFELSL
jgi:hypothetical protein